MASFPQACPTIVCDSSNQCLWHSSSPALRRRRTTCCVPAACGGRAMLFGRERDARVCLRAAFVLATFVLSLETMQCFSCFCLPVSDARPLIPTHPQFWGASTVSPPLFHAASPIIYDCGFLADFAEETVLRFFCGGVTTDARPPRKGHTLVRQRCSPKHTFRLPSPSPTLWMRCSDWSPPLLAAQAPAAALALALCARSSLQIQASWRRGGFA